MFSILIPTFNNIECLKLCIKSIKNNSQFLNPNTISESTIPIRKFNILNTDIKSFLEKTLKEGTEKARLIAQRNLKEIKNVIGFF